MHGAGSFKNPPSRCLLVDREHPKEKTLIAASKDLRRSPSFRRDQQPSAISEQPSAPSIAVEKKTSVGSFVFFVFAAFRQPPSAATTSILPDFRRIPAHSGEQLIHPLSSSTARRCEDFPAISPRRIFCVPAEVIFPRPPLLFSVSLTTSHLVSMCSTVRSRLGALPSLTAAVSGLRSISGGLEHLRRPPLPPATKAMKVGVSSLISPSVSMCMCS